MAEATTQQLKKAYDCVVIGAGNGGLSAAAQLASVANCKACRSILVEKGGEALLRLGPEGHRFKHPDGYYEPAFQCMDVHSPGLRSWRSLSTFGPHATSRTAKRP